MFKIRKKSVIKHIKEEKITILSFAIGFFIQLPIGSKIIGYDINKKIIIANLIGFLIFSFIYISLQLFIDRLKRKN